LIRFYLESNAIEYMPGFAERATDYATKQAVDLATDVAFIAAQKGIDRADYVAKEAADRVLDGAAKFVEEKELIKKTAIAAVAGSTVAVVGGTVITHYALRKSWRVIQSYRNKRLTLKEQKLLLQIVEESIQLTYNDRVELFQYVTIAYELIGAVKARVARSKINALAETWARSNYVLEKYRADTNVLHVRRVNLLIKLHMDVANEMYAYQNR
jgi:hypothetical protein